VGALAGALALSQSANVQAQVDARWHGPAMHARGPTTSRSDLTTAKRHYTEAVAKFRTGDYAEALSDFQLANDIKATPQAERYIGRCLDALGRFQEASEWYERFLSHVPDKMVIQGDRTRSRLTEIRGMKSAARPRATATTEPSRATEKSPVSRAEAADSEADPAVATTPPEQPAVAAAQTMTPVPPPPTPENHSPVLAYAAAGVALAAAGVGASFGILALNDKTTFDSNPTTQNASNRNAHALVADVAFGVVLASGATSAILFLTHHEAAPPPDGAAGPSAGRVARVTSPPAWTIMPTPIVGMHGAGAGLTVRF
jgi:tetratricopeptide (TPR) repeat protein